LLSTLHLGVLGVVLIILDFYGKPAAPRMGAMLLSALISVRMADSKFSLVTKGTVFVCTGIAFLVFNHFMARRNQQNGGFVE
jgi:membrane-bound ClpP family serine protease